jgi:hypothetical protein
MPRKCFVCGTVYNCEEYIDKVFQNIATIQNAFDDICIILSYDKCNDFTLKKLIHYKQTYSKYEIHINTNPRSPIRTENIFNARNAILDKMRELLATSKYDEQEWTHFIMMDFDDVCSEPIEYPVLLQYISDEWIDRWDALSFNREWYYDIWALSWYPFLYSCWGFEDPLSVVYIMREEITRQLANVDKNSLFECDSAFNGFAIYRCSTFLKCHYDWHLPKHFITEEQMNMNVAVLGFRQPLIPFDSAEDVPEHNFDCEHRHFHMQAKHLFGARIFISPLCLFTHDVTSH